MVLSKRINPPRLQGSRAGAQILWILSRFPRKWVDFNGVLTVAHRVGYTYLHATAEPGSWGLGL